MNIVRAETRCEEQAPGKDMTWFVVLQVGEYEVGTAHQRLG
jgi:hypothetical protein